MAYIYDLTDTWNAGGTTFNAIKMNVTDSASASASKLVTLQTNGTEHFSVTKAGVGYFSGNLGAGISSPTSKLHVVGATASLAQFTGPEYSQIRHSDGTRTLYTQVYNDLGVLGTESSTPLAFATANIEKMRITSGGNVGIGTSSPTTRLEVSGSLTTTADTFGVLTLGRYDSGFPWAIVRSDASATGIEFRNNAGDQVLSMVSSTKNIGIGTSSPSLKFVVSNGGAAGLEIDPTALASAPIIQSYNRSGAAYTQLGYSALQHVWQISGTERARIDGSGNLLVGTTATGGATTNTARVTGGIFSTFNATPSVPHNTATTVATLPSGDGVYLVTSALVNSGGPSDYNETAIVSVSQSTAIVSVLVNATAMGISMSGLNVQLTQGQGTTQTCKVSILRLL